MRWFNVLTWNNGAGRRLCNCCNTSWTRWCIVIIVVWPLVAYYMDHVMELQTVQHDETTKERWITDHTDPYHMTDMVDDFVNCLLGEAGNCKWIRNVDVMLTQRATPLLLTDTPYNSWSIWNWSFDSLVDNVELVLVKKSSHKMIKYFSNSQLLVSKPLDRPYNEILLPAKKLFKKLTGESDGHYYYASGGIELLGFKGRHVYSKESLREMTFRSHQQSLGEVNFWIGARNVTAHTHYDTSHNLHVVIRGRKKFLLWPPSAYDSLMLYPCLHHYYRQTYYTYTDSPSSIPTPLEIVLQPSDVIYIPPYWFHEVVTMEPSISINVWSDSNTFLIMEEVYRAPIPFEEHWGQVTLMKALWYFLQHLVGLVTREGTKFEDIIKKLVSKRYDVLQNDVTKGSHYLTRYCLTEHIEDILDANSIINIEKGSSSVARLFQKIPCLASREINLGNYIEHLCHRILGEDQLNLLPAILTSCYNSTSL